MSSSWIPATARRITRCRSAPLRWFVQNLIMPRIKFVYAWTAPTVVPNTDASIPGIQRWRTDPMAAGACPEYCAFRRTGNGMIWKPAGAGTSPALRPSASGWISGEGTDDYGFPCFPPVSVMNVLCGSWSLCEFLSATDGDSIGAYYRVFTMIMQAWASGIAIRRINVPALRSGHVGVAQRDRD